MKRFLEELKQRFCKNGNKLILRDSGSYSIVLGTKEWVLKICKEKITWNCPRKSFLLNPSEFYFIQNEFGIPIAGIEWQHYLPKVEKKITRDLIYQYLVELRNQNLTLADSTSLAYNNSNFRFLNDMSHLKENKNELPNWFLENPIVCVDIDAIYQRGENQEADKKMDEAISNFKK